MISTIQIFLFLALSFVAFGLALWAFLDAATRVPQAFAYAGKRTKNFWLALTGGAALLAFLGIPPPLGIGVLPAMFVLIAVIPAGIYLADVRPAVRSYPRGGGGRRPPSGW